MNEETVNRIVSQTDADIADIVAQQPADISVVTERTYNQWDLPEECVKREGKEYKYRWLSKDRRMLDRARYKGWIICNGVNSPYIKSEKFALHGAIERHGHLLGCMPVRKAQAIQEESGGKSADAVKYYTEDIKKDPRFYDAKLSSEDTASDPDFK